METVCEGFQVCGPGINTDIYRISFLSISVSVVHLHAFRYMFSGVPESSNIFFVAHIALLLPYIAQ